MPARNQTQRAFVDQRLQPRGVLDQLLVLVPHFHVVVFLHARHQVCEIVLLVAYEVELFPVLDALERVELPLLSLL